MLRMTRQELKEDEVKRFCTCLLGPKIVGEVIRRSNGNGPEGHEVDLENEMVLDIQLTDTDKFLFNMSRFTNVISPIEVYPDDMSELARAHDILNDLFWANLHSRVMALDPSIQTYGIREGWQVVKVFQN